MQKRTEVVAGSSHTITTLLITQDLLPSPNITITLPPFCSVTPAFSVCAQQTRHLGTHSDKTIDDPTSQRMTNRPASDQRNNSPNALTLKLHDCMCCVVSVRVMNRMCAETHYLTVPWGKGKNPRRSGRPRTTANLTSFSLIC